MAQKLLKYENSGLEILGSNFQDKNSSKPIFIPIAMKLRITSYVH